MDPFNPTPENIRAWAADPAAQREQDWDLVVTNLATAPLLIELAADPSCPKRQFFLNACIYSLGMRCELKVTHIASRA